MSRRDVLPIALALLASTFAPSAFTRQRDPARPPVSPSGRDASTSPSTGTAVISGVVMSDEANPRPVRRVALTLTGSGNLGGRIALTDDAGRFVISGLSAGRFTMMVSKPGWVANYYGAGRPGRAPGATIALTDGQKLALKIALTRGAVIAGRVADQNGVPQSGARLAVAEIRTIGGERVVSPANLASMTMLASADDRGEFRLYGLPPGSYIVSAAPLGSANAATAGARLTTPDEVQWALRSSPGSQSPAPGRMVGYAPVYYPGTPDLAAAVQVTVGAGEERTGIDFVLPLVPMARIAGTLVRSDGAPVQGAQVFLALPGIGAMSPSLDATQSRAVTDARGRFVFPSVRPSQYRLLARAPSRPPVRPQSPDGRVVSEMASMDLYAQAELTVAGRDFDDLSLTLQPGSTISGRIVFEATTLGVPTDLSRTFLQLTPPTVAAMLKMASIDLYSASTTADGTFAIAGVVPGAYALNARLSPPPGTPADAWMVKSIQSRGRDVSDAPIEVRQGADVSDVVITFTDRTSEVSGTIFDANGKAAPGYFVFLFPAERSGWSPFSRRFRPPSQPSTDGKYRVPGLPPGEYYVTALTELDPLDILDESFLQQLTSAAFKITLREGEKKVQDIRIK